MTRDEANKSQRAGPAGAEARRKRLAAELRANLKRRKVQAKARRAGNPEEDAGAIPHDAPAGDKEGR